MNGFGETKRATDEEANEGGRGLKSTNNHRKRGAIEADKRTSLSKKPGAEDMIEVDSRMGKETVELDQPDSKSRRKARTAKRNEGKCQTGGKAS